MEKSNNTAATYEWNWKRLKNNSAEIEKSIGTRSDPILVSYNQSMIVFGGTFKRTFWEYCVASRKWFELPFDSMSVQDVFHSNQNVSGDLYKNKLYMTSGHHTGGRNPCVLSVDLRNFQAKIFKFLPEPLQSHFVITTKTTNKMYVFGSGSTSLFILDLNNKTPEWEVNQDLFENVDFDWEYAKPVYIEEQNTVCLFGSLNRTLWELSLNTYTLKKVNLTGFQGAFSGLAAAWFKDINTIVGFGGSYKANQYGGRAIASNKLFLVNPDNGKVKAISRPKSSKIWPSERRSHAATRYKDNMIVFGGYDVRYPQVWVLGIPALATTQDITGNKREREETPEETIEDQEEDKREEKRPKLDVGNDDK